jgi:Arylsulfatase A and related enzymes
MYPESAGPPFEGHATAEGDQAEHPAVAAMQAAQPLKDFFPGGAGMASELTEWDYRRLRALYFGLISEVDAQLGRLFETLKARGAWEDTVVVFTSDHGEMMGDHHMLGKVGYFPQSFHIPLVLKIPGYERGVTVSHFTSAVDVFPTLAAVMDVVPEHVPDGASLWPFAAGEVPETWRSAALWEFDFRQPLGAQAAAMGLAPEDCVLVTRMERDWLYMASPGLPPALYDRQADPGCTRNLADSPHHAAMRLDQAEALLAARARLADRTLARCAVWDWHTVHPSHG